MKADIDRVQEVEESPMPPDFVEQLSTDQINDLMSFLMAPEEGMR